MKKQLDSEFTPGQEGVEVAERVGGGGGGGRLWMSSGCPLVVSGIL